jgi:hypothetical protein
MVIGWLFGTWLGDLAILVVLLAFPAWLMRHTFLEHFGDAHLFWKLVTTGLFFSLGAVSGLKWLNLVESDVMTVWFLPLMGALYLHVAVTHAFDLTAKISLCFLVISYPCELIRSEMHGTVVPSPLEAVSEILEKM